MISYKLTLRNLNFPENVVKKLKKKTNTQVFLRFHCSIFHDSLSIINYLSTMKTLHEHYKFETAIDGIFRLMNVEYRNFPQRKKIKIDISPQWEQQQMAMQSTVYTVQHRFGSNCLFHLSALSLVGKKVVLKIVNWCKRRV